MTPWSTAGQAAVILAGLLVGLFLFAHGYANVAEALALRLLLHARRVREMHERRAKVLRERWLEILADSPPRLVVMDRGKGA
jgi:hypothetical protein